MQHHDVASTLIQRYFNVPSPLGLADAAAGGLLPECIVSSVISTLVRMMVLWYLDQYYYGTDVKLSYTIPF